MVYKEQQPVAPVRVLEATAATSRDISYPATPVGTLMVLDVIATTATQVGIARTSDGAADATWVQAAQTTYSTTNHQTRRYFKASDGTAGAVRVTSVSVLVHAMITFLNGWQGVAGNLTDYSSIFSQGNNASTGTTFPFSGFESAGAKNGVALSFVGLSTNPSSWTAWSAQTPIPATASESNGSRFWHVIDDYTGDAPDTTVTWLGSRTIRYTSSIIPLAVVAGGTNYTSNPGDSATVTDAVTVSGDSVRGADETVNVTDAVSASLASGLTATASDQAGVTDAVSTSSAASRSADEAVAVTDAVYPVLVAGGATGRSVPTQAEMPTAPYTDLETAPSYTFTSNTGTVSGLTNYAPDSAVVKLTQAAARGVTAGEITGFVRPYALADISGAGTGTNPTVIPQYGVRVETDATTLVFRLYQRSYSGFSNVTSRAQFRVKINGKWTTVTPLYYGATVGYPTNPDAITAGEYILTLTFPTAVMRKVELSTHLSFGGVAVNTGAVVNTPAAPKHRLVVIGGSLEGAEKHQTGNFALTGGSAGTYTALSSYIQHAALELAYDETVVIASGGSGYGISGDTVSLKSAGKQAEVIAFAGDSVAIGPSNNDITAGRTVSEMSTDLGIVLSNIRSGSATAPIFVLGAFTPPAMGSQASAEATVAPYNAAAKAQCQAYSAWFINPATGQTYDPQGNLRSATSNWVYQNTGNIASDGGHPTQEGSRALGSMFATAVREAHPTGSTATDYTATPADTVGATDGVATAQALSRDSTETVGVVDAATRAIDANRALTDSAGASDTATGSLDASRATSDAASATDSWTVSVTAARAPDDVVSVTDLVSVVFGPSAAVADTIGVADSVSVVAVSSSAPGDAVTLGDAVSASLALTRTPADTIPVTDAVIVSAGLTWSPTDVLSVTDQVSVYLTGMISAADGVTITDLVFADLTVGPPPTFRLPRFIDLEQRPSLTLTLRD